MKKILSILLTVFVLFGLVACASTPAADGDAGIKVFMVGDSTVASFNDPYYYPRYGYGTKLGDYLEGVEVVNYALSGRSSKSFLVEENYTKLQNEIKKGDFLIIGFGHNDEKTETARYTNPVLDEKDPTSFQYHLYEKYIKLALDAKATPILATPIVRRSPKGEYTGSVIHQTKTEGDYVGGDYAQAIRDLGKKYKITVIDLTTITKELYETVGPEVTLKYHAWLTHKPDSVDNTHLNAYGASVVAYNIAKELAASKNKLGKYVKQGIVEPVEVLVLDKNPSYVIPKYETPTASDKSAYWVTSEPWRGTVFGDCGGAEKINPEKGMFEITENGKTISMRSGTSDGTSVGKIASSSDGIAFYFQMLPIDKDFEFSATATVKFAANNNQVAFGLMARDDVYFDKFDNSIKSDYVVAGAIGLASTPWNGSFQRASAALVKNPASVEAKPAAGTTVDLKLIKKGNEYTMIYGNEAPVTVVAELNDVDKENIFVGLFTSRCIGVDYTNVNLIVK